MHKNYAHDNYVNSNAIRNLLLSHEIFATQNFASYKIMHLDCRHSIECSGAPSIKVKQLGIWIEAFKLSVIILPI